jgi:hypothetical protein
MRTKILLAALAATAFATPAMAQTTASATGEARGTVLNPLTLQQMQPLDFGTVLASAVPGSVTINANDGSRSFGGAGGVTPIALDDGQRGEFFWNSTFGETVEVTLTPPAGGVLTRIGGAETVAVRDWDLDGGAANDTFQTRLITDPDGNLVVGVGATFDIAADQESGVYTANYDLTVEYN